MNWVVFWKRMLMNLGFVQENNLTWFVVSIDDYPYLDYQHSIVMMAPLCRFNPISSKLLDIEPEDPLLIDKIGWGEFFRSFDGYNVEITHQFSLSIKENVA